MKDMKNRVEEERKVAENARREAYAKSLMEAALDKFKRTNKDWNDAWAAHQDAIEELHTLEATPLEDIEVPEYCGVDMSHASDALNYALGFPVMGKPLKFTRYSEISPKSADWTTRELVERAIWK